MRRRRSDALLIQDSDQPWRESESKSSHFLPSRVSDPGFGSKFFRKRVQTITFSSSWRCSLHQSSLHEAKQRFHVKLFQFFATLFQFPRSSGAWRIDRDSECVAQRNSQPRCVPEVCRNRKVLTQCVSLSLLSHARLHTLHMLCSCFPASSARHDARRLALVVLNILLLVAQ